MNNRITTKIDSDHSKCISKLNLAIDHRCLDFLDRYWSNQDVLTTKEDIYLYNDLCGKHMREVFEGIFTSLLPLECQRRYFAMIHKNCSSSHVLGMKHGKRLKNFLDIMGSGIYFPMTLSFSAFALGERNPTFINYQSCKHLLAPYMIAAWNNMGLIKPEEKKSTNAFIWWKKKTKIFYIYKLLTPETIQEEQRLIIRSCGFNQFQDYIKQIIHGMLLSYFENNLHYVSLPKSLVIGYIIRNLTRKSKNIFTIKSTKDYVKNFVEYTENKQIEKPLENLLMTICRSKFVKQSIHILKEEQN